MDGSDQVHFLRLSHRSEKLLSFVVKFMFLITTTNTSLASFDTKTLQVKKNNKIRPGGLRNNF